MTNLEKMEAVYEDAHILITDKKLSSLQEILPVFERVAETGKKDLVIIADDVDGEALSTFIVNRMKGIFNILAIKAPSFGEQRAEILEDIAILTGATVISEISGLKLEAVTAEQLGKAGKIISTKEKTTIVDGYGDKDKIDLRIKQLRSLANDPENTNKDNAKERLAKLTGGVAVIKVGAATELEQTAKLHKAEDGLNATRAAVEEGIVPGGGVTLLRAKKALEGLGLEGDEATGLRILKKALEAPIRQIAENAGIDGAVVIMNILKKTGWYGFNAQTMEYEDLMKSGIVDPAKVVRSSLQNAVSAAVMFLTTGVVITIKPIPVEKDQSQGLRI